LIRQLKGKRKLTMWITEAHRIPRAKTSKERDPWCQIPGVSTDSEKANADSLG
jgi:hypothetical protein